MDLGLGLGRGLEAGVSPQCDELHERFHASVVGPGETAEAGKLRKNCESQRERRILRGHAQRFPGEAPVTRVSTKDGTGRLMALLQFVSSG